MSESEEFQQRPPMDELNGALSAIREEISKVIVGQHQLIDLLITSLLSDGHILIEGVPGVAKTLVAKLTARLIQAKFSRIQFTPDLMPSDVIGTAVFNPGDGNFHFKPGPIFGNVILIDEINRAPAKTQSALFEVMEERQITVDGTTHVMAYPFIVLATQNPIEQEGTYRLPEAQLDRFLFKVNIAYPTLDEEMEILNRQLGKSQNDLLNQVSPIIGIDDLIRYRKMAQQVIIEPKLVGFIAQIIHETRNNASLYLGASPRASLALLRSSKSFAATRGRDFVIPDDITVMAYPILRHRIMLTPEKEMEGVTPDALIESILKNIEIPR